MDDEEITPASDAECIARVQSGDVTAYGELWRRHYRSALAAARSFTSLDADDLVSEAFARVYQKMLTGGGPTGAFRPYLYATIRNLARSWGSISREVQLDTIEEFPDDFEVSEAESSALDRSLTVSAFRSLPERWQTVLWYTEVEGMDPHEVAPLLGMSPNGVAALSYRAREGLRRAWLQSHVNDAQAFGECRWVRSRLGDRTRDGLGKRDRSRVEAHLASCASCTRVSEEVSEVASSLAMALLPVVLGGGAGVALAVTLARSDSGSGAMADIALPSVPDSLEGLGAAPLSTHHGLDGGAAALAGAMPAAGGLAAVGAGAGGLVKSGIAVAGSAAVVAAIGGGIILGPAVNVGNDDATDGSSSSETAADRADSTLPSSDTGTPRVDPANPGTSSDGTSTVPVSIPGTLPGSDTPGAGDSESGPSDPGTSTPGEAPGTPTPKASAGGSSGLIGSLIDDLTGDEPPAGHDAPGGLVGATIDLGLAGTATPGAHLSLQAAGQVYATTTVKADGTFSLNVTALPQGITGLKLIQTIDRGYLEGEAKRRGLISGLVGSLLGTVEKVLASLIVPIKLTTPTGEISINLLTAG